MDGIDFIKLDSAEKDKGQRIELDVVVGAADVAACMGDFYSLMVRVKRVGLPNTACGEEQARALEELVGAQALAEACRDFVLNRFTTAAVRQLDLDTVLAPGVHADDFPARDKDFAFTVSVTPRPRLSLSSVEPVHVKRRVICVEEADIQEQLAYTAEQFASLVPADHDDVQEGDWVLMDVDMTKSGKRLKDLSGVRRSIQLEKGLVPVGFLVGVLGMRPGDMRKVEFSVPAAEAPAAETSADAAAFASAAAADASASASAAAADHYKADVTLHQVQKRVVPEIDDAWVAGNLPQFETLEGFRQSIRRDLEEQKARVEQQDLVYRVRAALAERLQGALPDEMYQQAKESLITQTMRTLEAQGKTLEEYLEEHEMTQDAFNMNVFLQASDYLRQNLALDALAQELGLQESEEEVKCAKSQLANGLAQLSDEEFAKRGFRKSLGEHIRREKALAWAMETMIEK